MPDWRVDVLRGLGAPITKDNMSFLTNWHRWEGGHTKNDASWNWLNTTRDDPGAMRSINSVGVKAFDSYDNGVKATINTLKNGYYTGIVKGLQSGAPSRSKEAALGLSTWVAGPNADPRKSARYIGDVLGIGKIEAWKLVQSDGGQDPPASAPLAVPKASGSSASVTKVGQTYGGGGDSPQRLMAASNADGMYRQALQGFLLGRAQARMQGQNPRGGLMQLAQLRQQYQDMGGVPDTQQTTGAAVSNPKRDPAAEIDDGDYKTTPAMANEASATSDVSQRILGFAHKQIGQDYVWGAESRAEGGFDCSGLIDAAYRAAGIDLPGRLTTYSAAKLGKSVKGQPLRAGDMIISNGGEHMVMYVGDNRVIAAPRTGTKVQYQPLSRFSGDIVDIRRVIP